MEPHQRTLHHATRYKLLVGVAKEAGLVSYRDSGSYASSTPIFNAELGPLLSCAEGNEQKIFDTSGFKESSKQHNEYTESQCDKGQLLFTLVYNSDLRSLLLTIDNIQQNLDLNVHRPRPHSSVSRKWTGVEKILQKYKP